MAGGLTPGDVHVEGVVRVLRRRPRLRQALEQWLTKYNENHDPANGQFASGGGSVGRVFSQHVDGITGSELPHSDAAWQYAHGHPAGTGPGSTAVYRRPASQAGTYGGWRWEADSPEKLTEYLRATGAHPLAVEWQPTPTRPWRIRNGTTGDWLRKDPLQSGKADGSNPALSFDTQEKALQHLRRTTAKHPDRFRDVLAKEYREEDHPRAEDGEWTDGGGSLEFVSPNRGEGGDLPSAEGKLGGFENQRLMLASKVIHRRLGIPVEVRPAVGAWTDGAEHTTVATSRSRDFERIRVAAAMQGLLGEQKAVIPFAQADDGPDTMHVITLAGKHSTQAVHEDLLRHGVEFHTIEPGPSGVRVYVFNPGSDLGAWKNVSSFSKANRGNHARIRGKGEFLGSDSSREAGATEYRSVIDAYQTRLGRLAGGEGSGWFDRLHHLWRSGQGVLRKLLKWEEADHPRVPGGSGDPSGEFTSGGGGGALGAALASAGQADNEDYDAILQEYDTPEVRTATQAAKDRIKALGGGTHLIDTEARTQLRSDLLTRAIQKDMEHTVRRERIVDIVIGGPASGKSSQVAEPIAAYSGSLLVDADRFKTSLPEFGTQGEGAAAVHEESSQMALAMERYGRRIGANMTLPLVGKDQGKIERMIKDYHASGYEVRLHYVDVPVREQVRRAIARWKSRNRFVPPEYIVGVDGKPRHTFKATKDLADSWYEYDNNVPPKGTARLLSSGTGAHAHRSSGPGRVREPGAGRTRPRGLSDFLSRFRRAG